MENIKQNIQAKKKKSSTTKITNSKTKKNKAQLTNFIQNNQPCPLNNSKRK